MKNNLILIVLLALVQSANAVQVLAVLEIVPKDGVEDISVDEVRHLTDELRRQATNALPQNNYSILTRDNILALIPPDEKEAECLAEGCAVDIGRVIGAEYVTSGSIGKFSGEYSLSIELYETMGGKLLGSIVMESQDIKGLLNVIREQAAGLFSKMYQNSQNFNNLQNEKKDTLDLTPNPIPNTLNPNTQKTKTSTWIAISLDVAGAALLGVGIYKAVQHGNLHDDYKKEPSKEAYDKVEDARKMRDIGFIAGGTLLASGIAIHIFF